MSQPLFLLGGLQKSFCHGHNLPPSLLRHQSYHWELQLGNSGTIVKGQVVGGYPGLSVELVFI